MPPQNSGNTLHHHLQHYHHAHLDNAAFSPGSNEADDERSPSPLNLIRAEMWPQNPARQQRQAYAGEDTRPTSSKELAGWYSYGWAAEVLSCLLP